jgi:hypothetical protein
MLNFPVVSNNIVILPDPHCPAEDSGFIERVMRVANEWEIKECVICGDLLDLEAYSTYLTRADEFIETGLAHAEKIINNLILPYVDRVVWIMGNHEERLLKKIGKNQISMERLRRLVTIDERVEFSPFYYAYTKDKKWMICHPDNYSRSNPVGVGATLCAKYHCNIIAGHMHVVGKGQDISGKYMAIVSGTCADTKEGLEYDYIQPSTNPAMLNGATIINNDHPWLLDKWTDWKALENAY